MSQVIEKDFLQLVKEITLLDSNLALLGWDMQTGMPEKSAEFRSELEGYVFQLYNEKMTGSQMQEFMNYFKENREELSDLGQKVYDKIYETYYYASQISSEDMVEYQKQTSLAYSAWTQARRTKNFQDFAPNLEKIIEEKRKFIPLWRRDEKTNYDVLLGQYEPKITCEILDKVFAEVKEGILEIRKTLQEKGVAPKKDFLSRNVPKEAQIEFAKHLSEQLGFDFSRGRLDEAIHPFMTDFNIDDVRLTSRWREDDFQMGVFGVLHEQGHGQYAQNVDPKLAYTPLSGKMTMGIHESQSLFQEIIIGSNKNFWKKQFPKLNQVTNGTFADIDFEDFYKALKFTQSSLIRVEADSLTYILHIIIRYEIEKAIFNENVSVQELPKLWNDLYEEYLGVRPENDLEGILQDIHWTYGDFGYFPSYALGFMYAAQIQDAMRKIVDIDAVLASDNYTMIKNWLDQNIRVYGASIPSTEVIRKACGEDLNPKYLLAYLKKIYFEAYSVSE